MKGHSWKLIETRQWSDGNGHIAIEKCVKCGRVARTSVGYLSKEAARRGNYDTDENEDENCLSRE